MATAKDTQTPLKNTQEAISNLRKPSKLNYITNAIESVDLEQLKSPNYKELFYDLNVQDTIDGILGLIKLYKAEGIMKRLNFIRDDSIKLAAMLVELSLCVGGVQGVAYYDEHNLKIHAATVSAKAEKLASNEGMSLSSAEFQVITRLATQNARQKMINNEAANKALTNFYFSVRQFLDVLNSAAMLASRPHANL